MGNSASIPERVYKAVKANNVFELQDLINQWRRVGSVDARTKQAYFCWVDSDGRTPLMLAAAKNYYQVAKLLLENGADVRAHTNKGQGSAIHEAVAHRNETMVELLLQHGANPFEENHISKTAYDLAAAPAGLSILRSLEKFAMFTGYVQVKVSTLGGLSWKLADRWAVVFRCYTRRRGANLQETTQAHIALWLFKDKASYEPRTKVWLDGAKTNSLGNSGDGFIRLHPTHEEPRNVATKFDKGYMIFIRLSSNPANVNPTQRYTDFVNACNGHDRATPPAPLPEPDSVSSPSVFGLPPAHPFSAPHSDTTGPSYRPFDWNVPSAETAAVHARPGESDEEFARRLSGPGAGPFTGPPTRTGAPSGAPSASVPAAPAERFSAPPVSAPPPATVAPAGNPFAAHAALHPAGSSSSAGTISPATSLQPPLSHPTRVGESDPGAEEPSAPPLYPAVPAAGPPPSMAAFISTPPTSSTAPSRTSTISSATLTRRTEEEDDTCVICLTNDREVGFLHGATVHKCVCRECAQALGSTCTQCPMCRQRVERIIGVF